MQYLVRYLALSVLTLLLITYGYLSTHYTTSTIRGSTDQLISLTSSSNRLTHNESKSTSDVVNHIHNLAIVDPVHGSIHNRPATILLQRDSRDTVNASMLQQETVSSSIVRRDGGGYALAGDYWEQLTSGSRNLQNLQCWAGKIGLNVVEPFAVNSVLQTPLSVTPPSLKFSDLIDMESWNIESIHLGNARLQSWETFLREASHDVITVQFKYAYSKEIIKKKKEMTLNPTRFPPREIRYKQGCSPWPKQALLEERGFKIVRRVCLNFEYGDVLSLDELKNEIFGLLDPASSTVYYKQWRGLAAAAGRIPITDAGCGNTGIQEHIQPSQRLLTHTNQYLSKYLTTSTGHGYIAIMGRLEKSKISFNRRPGIVSYCLKQTLEQWRDIVTKTGLNRTFLAVDIGKYGSKSFKNTGDSSNLGDEFSKFFRSLYDDHLTMSGWEKSFEDIVQTKDAGYIALLQKMVVTRATCVLFVGGGSFQKHALGLYKNRVQQSEWCIHIVKECTLVKNLALHH